MRTRVPCRSINENEIRQYHLASAMLTNTLANDILAQTVTAANFSGPPMLLIGQGLISTSDPRWQAVLGLATQKSVPLVGISPEDSTLPLHAGLEALSRFFVPGQTGTYVWTDGVTTEVPSFFFGTKSTPSFLGPILCCPDVPANDMAIRVMVWAGAIYYARHANYNRYGVGLLACGPGDPNGLTTPPVYPLRRDFLQDDVTTLANVWVRGGPVEQSSLETLVALEATRPGISRRVHPALVPYILLEDP